MKNMDDFRFERKPSRATAKSTPFAVRLLLLLLFIIYLICQKRQGDTKRQSLYKGVSLEDTKLKTEGTNTEKNTATKTKKEHIHI